MMTDTIADSVPRAPAEQAEPTRASPSKALLFDVPLLARRGDELRQLETLLLAWALHLYRNNIGNHVQFSWTLRDLATSTNTTLTLDTSNLSWDATAPLEAALEAIRGYLRQDPETEKANVAESGYTFFFNDEASLDGTLPKVEQGDHSISWGNVEIEASLIDGKLWLQPAWLEPVGASFIANHYAHSIVEMLSTRLTDLTSPLGSALELGDLDRGVLWNWNQEVPATVSDCIHSLIDEQFKVQPDATAICSWDGDFTYAEVDRHSTVLAHHLISLGLEIGDIVPLCFEKSRWTTVALLGVTKAGGAFVMMDPTQPLQRRQTMASQVHAKIILTSNQLGPYGPTMAPEAKTVVVDDDNLHSLGRSTSTESELPKVPPESLLYVIFTSGSTGMPKGVMINHETYTTSALARSTAIGYKADSRTLDFTSYAFDVSIDSMFCTLLRGGCLCIPTDEDRMNDLSGVIRRLQVNMANMTPSVARILDPDIIPSLHSLGLGGESCSAADCTRWGQHTRIVVGYGPSECTIGCTVNESAAGKPYVSIGPGTGAVIWLVDPNDHNKLVPVGAVGELLVEGPLVGQGYLRDPVKTATAFIDNPTFLAEGGGDVPGRKGRLYKTGDLVRYDPDGEVGFVFVGRKDTQIKLRGQRVELGEIEHHINNLIPSANVVVEIIAPKNMGKESVLVSFIANRDATKTEHGNADAQPFELPAGLREQVANLNEKLSKVLPVYMVPAAYIGVSRIPMLVSGKTDRKTLRALGASLDLQSAPANGEDSEEHSKPESEEEIALRDAWCQLLNLETDKVSRTHNFFILGGESIMGMRLVPMIRERGYIMTVADVFNSPVLADMAKVLHRADGDASLSTEVPPFSLLSAEWDHDAILTEASEQCGASKDVIEDIYPCAPMQEIHVAFYTRSSEAYVAQRVAPIPDPRQIDKLKAAWDTVIKETAILRTRIVEFKQHGFMQVVVDEPIQWQSRTSELETFLEEDGKEPMTVSTPLCRFTIVHDPKLDERYFVWTAHHAIYDGWSTDLIVEHAQAAYKGLAVSRPAEFKHFIHYLADPAREASKDYWRSQLEGATGPQFPALPSRSFIPKPDSMDERFIPVDQSVKSDITIATVIRAAWSLVASQYAMSDDVVFGETFSGRTLPIAGAELIEGPILATLPVRVRIDRTATVQEFLRAIQEQNVARAAHEHLGIQNIRRLSPDAQIACEVMMGLVVQPKQPAEPEASPEELPAFRVPDAALEALHFNSYPVMLAASLEDGGFRLLASFDSRILSRPQLKRVLAQFECAITALRGDQNRLLNDLSFLSDGELAEIWETNQAGPVAPQDISKSLTSGDKYPTIQYNPWIVHSGNEGELMPIGTVGELLLEGVGEAANIAAPEWLKNGTGSFVGRQNMLYRTGDLVKYADDMSLIFMGRKDSWQNVDGQVINLTATDVELKRLLPANTQACSQLVVPQGSTSQTPIVVAFIQETSTTEERQFDLGIDGANVAFPLSSTVSASLAKAIIGLNKALTELLPPKAVPSICIPVAKTTDSGEPIDLQNVESLKDKVTLSMVSELRRALVTLRRTISEATLLSTKQKVLISLWSKYLGVEEEKLSLDDNFFRLGGDSIMAMRMVSELRRSGYNLSVTDMFMNMKLRDMAKVTAGKPEETAQSAKEYAPFSLLGQSDLDTFLGEHVRPQLADSTWTVNDVLPVTGPQEIDIKQTVSAPRCSVQYNMLYLEEAVDTVKVIENFRELVAQHPILRTVFVWGPGEYLQVVLKDMDLSVTQLTVEEPVDQACKKLAASDVEIDSAFALGAPWLHIWIVHGSNEKALMIRISHAQYDGVALPEVLRQLELRYRDQETPVSEPFAKYIEHVQESRVDNIKFWRKQLQGSSLAEIIAPAEPRAKTTFITKPVDVSARVPETSFAMLLIAGWAKILAQHLNISDVTFGGIVSGRDTADLTGVDGMIGPCYQYMPIRVKFESGWTATQLIGNVRSQYLEGSPRATLSFQDVAQQCTNWPATASFYPSFVNHLDKEFFDALPFGDTKCRVDYIIPHPEAATPPRVVSFAEAGKTFIGIEADEERRAFWEARLEELAVAVEGFVTNPEAAI